MVLPPLLLHCCLQSWVPSQQPAAGLHPSIPSAWEGAREGAWVGKGCEVNWLQYSLFPRYKGITLGGVTRPQKRIQDPTQARKWKKPLQVGSIREAATAKEHPGGLHVVFCPFPPNTQPKNFVTVTSKKQR
uniref:Uncharacterized protein n=1 Tax=Chrysemys picta bellii TaxID=8478 RepID=A0A8C3J1R0_CHRPI